MRAYRPGDEHGILDLFRRVFRADRSLAHWRWKFLDNPAGRQITLAVSSDGHIVGQFASLPNRAATRGGERVFTQLLDHMVDPALHRRGVYAAMWQHFRDGFAAPDPAAVVFGYNLDEIHQIQKRLYGMRLMHGVGALRFELSHPEPWRGDPLREIPSHLYRVERVDRFDAEVDELWQRSRARYGAAVVRDARYLGWRYADCPDVRYVLLAARSRLSGRLAGIAVLRLGWPHEPIAALVDWLVAEARRSVWIRLLDACHAEARRAGLPAVEAWLPESSPDHAVLLALGYRCKATPFLLSVLDDGRPERPLALLQQSWHYTMGDTDIF